MSPKGGADQADDQPDIDQPKRTKQRAPPAPTKPFCYNCGTHYEGRTCPNCGSTS